MRINLERYNYIDLKRVDYFNGGRIYLDPNGNELPSVTSILSKTMDKSVIDAWRKRIGDAQADRELKWATDVGGLMHQSVEKYILGMDRSQKGNYVHRLAENMADKIIKHGLSKVSEVWGVEVPLYYPGLYAGCADLIGVYDGLPSIMDHKNSKTIKKEEYMEGYYLQGAAYSMAHNYLYNTNIRQVVLFMVGRNDMSYKTFILNGDKFDHYTNLWIEKMDQYYAALENINT